MIERTRYTSEYAPPANELVKDWTESLPSSSDLESFFLNELCESSEHEYFLCVADVFLDVVRRQSIEERVESLKILAGRLVLAAEFARGIADRELQEHFAEVIRGFSDLYQETGDWNGGNVDAGNRAVCTGYLALQAVVMDDLPLARLILFSYFELTCSNPDCDNTAEIQCPNCKSYAVPYDYHRQVHNMSNAPGHPKHPER